MFEHLERGLLSGLFGSTRGDAAPAVGPRPPAPATNKPPPPPPAALLDEGEVERAVAAAETFASGAAQQGADAAAFDDHLGKLDAAERSLVMRRVRDEESRTDPRLAALHTRLRDARGALMAAQHEGKMRATRAAMQLAPDAAEDGRLFVASATLENSVAYNIEGYTWARQLLQRMKDKPGADMHALLAQLSLHGLTGVPQDPSILDSEPRGKAEARDAEKTGQKVAVLIGNAAYQDMSTLGGHPVADTKAMQAGLAGRGYTTQLHTDKTTAQIGQIFAAAALDPRLSPGDSLILFFSGHGYREGLCGIDAVKKPRGNLYPYEQLNAVTRAAKDRGIDVTVMMDSCYSGEAVAQARRDEIAETLSEERGTDLEPAAQLARDIEALKTRYTGSSDVDEHGGGLAKLGHDGEEAGERAQLLIGHELAAEMRRLAARFEALTGRKPVALKGLSRIEKGYGGLDEIDELANEALRYVHTKQAERQTQAISPRRDIDPPPRGEHRT
jgi:hypothetical protein